MNQQNKKRIGVVLSGCGVMDGSEIHEATLALLHLEKGGAEVISMAPDVEQLQVVNHITNDVSEGEERNALHEAARIVRGKIQPTFEVSAGDLDGLVVVGGFGAAKNISDFAFREEAIDMAVEMYVQSLVDTMHKQGKPLGFMCIAPASVACVALKDKGIKVTVGNDDEIAAKIADLGNTHVPCEPTDIVIDEENNILSTPAYMTAQNIVEVDAGVGKLVATLLSRIEK